MCDIVHSARLPAVPVSRASELEALEYQVLEHFTDALTSTPSDEIRAAMLAQLPKIRACQEEMTSLRCVFSV